VGVALASENPLEFVDVQKRKQKAFSGLLPVTKEDGTIAAYVDPTQVMALELSENAPGSTGIWFITQPHMNVQVPIQSVFAQLQL
jgi:hypothetical protein